MCTSASVVAAPNVRAAAKPAASYQKVLTAAITELQIYWAKEFPDLYGDKYQPIPSARIIAARPGVKIPACQGHRTVYADVRGNAFYCTKSNFIAYDDVALMPRLAKTFGTFSVALVLAHERGDAIQDRAGNDGEQTVYLEQQADCFAGAFLEHVAENGNALTLKPGDLEASLGAMLLLRDAPGQSAADPSAHGSAFDRIGAFQDGYESGAEKCKTYFDDPPVLVELPFSNEGDAQSGGQTAAEDVIPLAVDLLTSSIRKSNRTTCRSRPPISSRSTARKPAPSRSAAAPSSPSRGRDRVFDCIDDGYIGFDEPFLQSVYDDIGDFGVTSLIANAGRPTCRRSSRFPGWGTTAWKWSSRPTVPAVAGPPLVQRRAVRRHALTGRPRRIRAGVPGVQPRPRHQGERADHVPAGRVLPGRLPPGYNACSYDEIAAATANIK